MDSKILQIAKRVAIEFFVLVFILGFFSKSIANYFLPKVSTVPVIAGVIQKSVDIEGIIEPKERFKVRFSGDVVIEDFFVEIGDDVKVGTPIFKINQKFGMIDIDKQIESLEISLEQEKNNLEKFTNLYLLADKKKIESLKEKIKNAEEELINIRKLYETGAVSKQYIDEKEQIIKDMKNDLEIQEILFKAKEKEYYLKIKEIQNRIERLQKEIDENKKRLKFYSKVSEDGIYYSEVEGIVINVAEEDRILKADTIIAEIGLVKDYNSVNFVSYVPVKNIDLIKTGKKFLIKPEGSTRTLEVKTENMRKVVESGMIKIICSFTDRFEEEIKKKPMLNRKYKGEILEKIDGKYVVPKSAVISDGEIKAGNLAKIFILEEKEGILGTEYRAVETDVKIVEVGDKNVDVVGLETLDEPRVIVNPSYKIKDGVKVYRVD